ncbi:outer membrane protein assembly factor BamD [Brevirhabdus pacifica]|uniref:Outer membrane protein assembly factor BamD n=1 Tax=Brevirhabdus pacifica TaxID=1267768 RepID=A0A1U7DKQ3_9RHOB|nr:outer membrane protein assembly factor BamD [Brevirhabdus pacifica]APX90570.1 outer membrane protein assembly factor BamD [Brevirhabdus pacifica]OWU78432.1 competence protein ComL [Loktanella sp. 22II-4b]PJJ85299.1 Beta-barrel assembly machine subunit BamD [Brevirhabdus pacifica]
MALVRRVSSAVTLVSVLALAGCGDSGGLGLGDLFATAPEASDEALTPEALFEKAEFQLSSSEPDRAATTFAEVERLYPYSELAKRAIIMQAFAYHQDKDYENSRASAQRYIEFYPADEDAAYAQYLLALSYYDQIDEVGRDQGLTFQALQALRTVIERYPDSEYARSAILKFDLAFDHLAAKEMEIGRYYLKRGHYAAAINRFRVVVEEFQTTTQTAEALHRLVEAYLSLGLDAEAQTAGAILGHNFKSTEWYEDSYRLLTGRGLKPQSIGDNWLSAIYRQVVRGEWL